VAELVRASGSDLGFVVDPDGESGAAIDDTGHVLSPEELMLAVVSLAGEVVPEGRITVPVNVTAAVETLLAPGAVERSKVWGTDLMERATGENMVFAGTADGGCIWPDFLPAFDAATTLVKLLDLLASTDRALSSVVAALPATHVVHDTVVTPWERKGTVMREVVERLGTQNVELLDGVKVVDDRGWVLVLPDPDEAVTHVWAEGHTIDDSRRLAEQYARFVRDAAH
jgi:mannose-1-phosphate guanylyltransferase/phosphomannomutase